MEQLADTLQMRRIGILIGGSRCSNLSSTGEENRSGGMNGVDERGRQGAVLEQMVCLGKKAAKNNGKRRQTGLDCPPEHIAEGVVTLRQRQKRVTALFQTEEKSSGRIYI